MSSTRSARREAASGTERSALIRVALLAGCALAAPSAEARDLVHLRTGRVLEGKVEKVTDTVVVLRTGGGKVYFPRADVYLIEREQALPEWEADLRRKLEEERREREERQAKERADRASEKEETGGGGASGRADAWLRRLVEDLASEDGETRRQARALLEREGKRAIPVLTDALRHGNGFARESAAFLLGKLNARESVRAMIIALSGAVHDARKVRFWQRGFVRSLQASLRSITGKNPGINLYKANQDKTVREYIKWWEGKAAKAGEVPRGAYLEWGTPQVGEPDIAEDDPEREKKLWAARRIGGEKASYSVPSSLSPGSVADQ